MPGHWPTYTDLVERGNHFTTRRVKLKWQNDVALFIKAGKIPALPAVHLRYYHYRKDRRSDKSNLAAAAMKIVEDALVQTGVLVDDRWDFVVDFQHHFVVDKSEGLKVLIIPAQNSV